MVQIALVGLGAGAASALLFASAASGSLLAVLLFNLAPLPVLIAALGWNHWAGLLAGFTAAICLGLFLSFHFFFAFLIGTALPAWWLSYLSMLARPVASNGSTTSLEWYPVGRLVLWAAIIAACLIAVATLNIGTDKATFDAALRAAFEQALRIQAQLPADSTESPLGPDSERILNFLVSVILPGAAVLATVASIFNLWLAAHVVKVSGRLHRPWPDLSSLTLPSFAPALVAGAIAGSFLPDLPGVLSGVAAASLLTTYAIVGFAVLHTVTRGRPHRVLALASTYAVVVVLVWPVLAMSLLGLADAAFNIRARVAHKRPPPDART
jgi:Predicted membrane protein (DUF2232)